MLLEPYFWKLLVSCKVFPEVGKKKAWRSVIIELFHFGGQEADALLARLGQVSQVSSSACYPSVPAPSSTGEAHFEDQLNHCLGFGLQDLEKKTRP